MTPPATHGRIPPNPSSAASCRGDDGLITLEWLLIVGAVASLAASSVLVVQRVADDAAEAPIEPAVRFIDAEIAAAAIGAEATDLRLRESEQDLPGVVNEFNTLISIHGTGTIVDYRDFEQRCDGLETTYDDAIRAAEFHRPLEYFENERFQVVVWFDSVLNAPNWALSPNAPDQILFEAGEIKAAARCEVEPRV